MSIEDRIKAAAKDVEGKLQSAAGEVTGDEQTKLEGDAKQIQADAMHAAAELKEKAQTLVDKLKHAATDAINHGKDKLD